MGLTPRKSLNLLFRFVFCGLSSVVWICFSDINCGSWKIISSAIKRAQQRFYHIFIYDTADVLFCGISGIFCAEKINMFRKVLGVITPLCFFRGAIPAAALWIPVNRIERKCVVHSSSAIAELICSQLDVGILALSGSAKEWHFFTPPSPDGLYLEWKWFVPLASLKEGNTLAPMGTGGTKQLCLDS